MDTPITKKSLSGFFSTRASLEEAEKLEKEVDGYVKRDTPIVRKRLYERIAEAIRNREETVTFDLNFIGVAQCDIRGAGAKVTRLMRERIVDILCDELNEAEDGSAAMTPNDGFPYIHVQIDLLEDVKKGGE